MVQTLSPILTALQLPASLCRQWRQGLPIILTVGTAMLERVVVPEWWSPTFYLIPLGLSFRNRDRRIALACATLVSGTPLLDFWGSAAEQDTTLNTHHAGVVLAAWVLALGTPSRLLDSSWMKTLGTWSYSIFLWHLPVLTIVFPLLGLPLFSGNFLLVFVVTVLLTIPVAAISYTFIEEPIMRWTRRAFQAGGR